MNKSTVILLILILFCSCLSIKLSFAKDNYIVGTKIYNKNVGISATFFGDMEFAKKSSNHKKSIRKLVLDDNLLKDKTIIAYSKTTAAPDYEAVLFYSTKKDSLEDGLIRYDSINNVVGFKISNNEKSFYVYLKSVRSKSDKSKLFQTIIADGTTIYKPILLHNLHSK